MKGAQGVAGIRGPPLSNSPLKIGEKGVNGRRGLKGVTGDRGFNGDSGSMVSIYLPYE